MVARRLVSRHLRGLEMTLNRLPLQGGSDADNVLADAYIKGLDKVKTINWQDAYKAVVSSLLSQLKL